MTNIAAVFFDLDGTLLDTAPDLVAAMNDVLQQNGHALLDFANARPMAAHGSRGLLQLALGLNDTHPDYANLRAQFFERYAAHLTTQTTLFAGIAEVLEYIEQQHLPWGIVTNKPQRFTLPLLQHLQLMQRASSIVSADTLAYTKPDPAPLLYACQQTKVKPEQCVYIGDTEVDAKTALNANMPFLLACYGYLPHCNETIDHTIAAKIDKPADIIAWLERR